MQVGFLNLYGGILNVRQERTSLIADNIANADTPGYKAMDVSFQQALATQLGDSSSSSAPMYRTDGTVALDGNDVDLDGETGIVRLLSGRDFCGPLRVSYRAGRPVVPASIQQGAKEVIRHMWETQRGHSGARPGFGDEDLLPTASGFTIPRRAMELLAPHRKAPLAA